MGLPDGPSNPAQGQNTGGWVPTGGKTVVREQPDGKRLLGPLLFVPLAIGEEAPGSLFVTGQVRAFSAFHPSAKQSLTAQDTLCHAANSERRRGLALVVNRRVSAPSATDGSTAPRRAP